MLVLWLPLFHYKFHDADNAMKKKIPAWVTTKNQISHDEKIVFVGQLGAEGVIDGKLPNGEPYDWSKATRSRKSRFRK